MRIRRSSVCGLCLAVLLPALTPQSLRSDVSASPTSPDSDTTSLVERMARIGRAFSPTFSPDGKQVALISDLNGVPHVWIVPTTGGWPRLVTSGANPIGTVIWSPTSDWLALSILPGGGLNSQVYVVRPDGTGLRRLTDG